MDEKRRDEKLTTSDLASAERRESDRRQAENVGRFGGGAAPAKETGHAPLFADADVGSYRARWESIQAGFVDEPRRSVEEADALVATAIKRLAEVFSEERQNLERQWSSGGEASTEDLRQAFRRYRSFFDRLLSM